MGADIHAWMEIRDAEDQPWRKVGRVFPYPYYNPERESEVIDEDGRPYYSNPQYTDDPIESRNYNLFAVLADVRNGRGFAGVETGNRIEPLPGAPRGLPDDVTAEGKEASDSYGADGHSQSWCLLQELLDYDWDAPYRYTGVLSAKQYEALQQGEEPDGWCGGISGPYIITLSEEQYADYKRTGVLAPAKSRYGHWEFAGGIPTKEVLDGLHVQARWDSKGGVRGAVGERWPKTFEEWATTYDPKNTRLVYFFDN